jgi:hypothetical protein
MLPPFRGFPSGKLRIKMELSSCSAFAPIIAARGLAATPNGCGVCHGIIVV